jgi:hypothetical protein
LIDLTQAKEFEMKLAVALLLVATGIGAPVLAQDKAKQPNSDAIRRDIADHRALAQVHENAAKCLEAGKSEKECHDQLAKECKGVGIGKYCGMRHRH